MVNKIKNQLLKILKNKKAIVLILLLCTIFIFLAGSNIKAETNINDYSKTNSATVKAIIGLLGWVVYFFAYVIGKILTFVISSLVTVASFNNIINVEAVKTGWVLVRDLCNMFFILILLIIAFATILRIENYSIKRLLPKLLIMAVLINFSRTICGIIIDFAQVIMITFINGLGDLGANNLVNLFQVKDYLSFNAIFDGTIGPWETAGAIVAGFIAMLVTFIVVLVMFAVLIMRIIMLWVYVILSPIAFLVEAFPAGKKFFNFWDDFIKQVVVGPILAFFLWLALKTASTSGGKLKGSVDGTEFCAGASQLFCSQNFITYVITIALLVGGLIVTQKIGGAAGKAAGWGMGKLNKGVAFGKSAPRRLGGAAVGASTAYLSQGGENTRRARFRDRLGQLGGSESRIATYTGARWLATKSLTGLEAKKRAKEEDAQKFVGTIGDTRILQRMARQSGRFSPWQSAVRDAARDKDPSGVSDNPLEVQNHINNMSREKFAKISKRGIAELGRRGIGLGPEALDYIQRDRTARRAYNEGVHESGGANWIRGRDRNGIETDDLGLDSHDYSQVGAGTVPAFDPTNSRFIRGVSPRVGAHAYRKVDDDKKSKARGEGNLSINEFGRNKSNTLAVDFDELGMSELKENLEDEFKDIKGINIIDAGTIKKVADKMNQIIDKELSGLQAKKNRTGGEEKRIKYLEGAKERFKDPGAIDNISLVNSSSTGYTLRDLKETKVHEEMHGYGIRDEETTEQATQRIIDTKQYSRRKEIGEKISEGKTIDEIINSEEEEKDKESYAEEYTKEFTPETKTIINNLVNSEPVSDNVNSRNIALLLQRLNKTLQSQTGSLGKINKNLTDLTNINPDKITPIEVNVITKKIKDQFSEEI